MLAIEYLTTMGISHRDIKPENILLDTNRDIKLIDFGLGKPYNPGELIKTACGSPCYAAPEMVARKLYRGDLVDIWSSGITLFAMLCGRPDVSKDSYPSTTKTYPLFTPRYCTGISKCPAT